MAGFALAYLQAPLADRLERMGMNRTIAALLIVVVVMLLLLAILLLVLPLLVQQLGAVGRTACRITSRASGRC